MGCAIPSVQITVDSSPESVNPTEWHIVVMYIQNETVLNKKLMMFSFQNIIASFFVILYVLAFSHIFLDLIEVGVDQLD